MKTINELKNEAIEMLKNDDDLFVEMVNELDSWNGFADGFRAYEMNLIDDLFYDMKVSDFISQLTGSFCHTDDYVVFSIYGIDSTNDIADLYRANAFEDELLDNIIDNASNLYFYNEDFENLINQIAEVEEAA